MAQSYNQLADGTVAVKPDESTTWNVVVGPHVHLLYARVKELLESSDPRGSIPRKFSLVDEIGVEMTSSRQVVEAGTLYLNYGVKGVFFDVPDGSFHYASEPDLAVTQIYKQPLMRCASNTNVSNNVEEMYRKHPYPPIRDDGSYEADLYAMEFLPFHRVRKSEMPQEFRVLIAGGGTGTMVALYARHFSLRKSVDELKKLGVHRVVVWSIDLSPTSMQLASKRVERWAYDRSFLSFHFRLGDLQTLGGDDGALKDVHSGGKFHTIDCSGVLHHLANPLPGMAALQRVLAPGGSIRVHIYGEEGRNGIYQTQEMVRILNNLISAASSTLGEIDFIQRIQLVKALIKSLPRTHGLRANRRVMSYTEVDYMRFRSGDIGIVDMFFHVCDRAFNLKEWSDHAELAQLEVWAPHYDQDRLAMFDNLEFTGGEQQRQFVLEALPLLETMPSSERAHFLELLVGNMPFHFFFLTHPGEVNAVPRDEVTLDSMILFADSALAHFAQTSDQSLVASTAGLRYKSRLSGLFLQSKLESFCVTIGKAASTLQTAVMTLRELRQAVKVYPQFDQWSDTYFFQSLMDCQTEFPFFTLVV